MNLSVQIYSALTIGIVGSISFSPRHAGEANPAKGMNLIVVPLAEAVGRPPKSDSATLARNLAVLRWLQSTHALVIRRLLIMPDFISIKPAQDSNRL